MGYYSDVALCLTKVGVEKLQKALAAAEQNDPERFEAIKGLMGRTPDRKDAETGAVAFMWGGLKWYADFADVAFVEDFMADLKYEGTTSSAQAKTITTLK